MIFRKWGRCKRARRWKCARNKPANSHCLCLLSITLISILSLSATLSLLCRQCFPDFQCSRLMVKMSESQNLHTLWSKHQWGFVASLNSGSKFLQERLSYWPSLVLLVNWNPNIYTYPGWWGDGHGFPCYKQSVSLGTGKRLQRILVYLCMSSQ